MTEIELSRFLLKVHRDIRSGCWLWTGQVTRRKARGGGHGYGRFKHHGRPLAAHRVAYEHWIGPVPAQLDHLCCTPSCVNPWHLEGVTAAENNRRAAARWADSMSLREQVKRLTARVAALETLVAA